MKEFRVLPGLLAAVALAGVNFAQAATVTTGVDNTQSMTGTVENGCLQQLANAVGDGENCMYSGGGNVYQWTPGPGTCPGDPPGMTTANCPADPVGESTGPWSQTQYYDYTVTPESYDGVSDNSFVALPNDGKISLAISGDITIDDNDDADPANDLIGFTLTMTSPDGGEIVRNLGTEVADKFTSMTQDLAPQAADFVTANADGGYDYVIGSAGFPKLLTFTDATANESAPGALDSPCVGQTFGNMECDASFEPTLITDGQLLDPVRWRFYDDGSSPLPPLTTCASPADTSSLCWKPTDQSTFFGLPVPPGQFPLPHVGPQNSPGIGSMENNIGPRTIGSLVDPDCNDDGGVPTGLNPPATLCTGGKTSFYPTAVGPNLAPGNGVTAEDVDWDQLYLKVSTDANGNVQTAEGFYVQEYQVFGPGLPCGNDPDPDPNVATDHVNACNSWLGGHFNIVGVVANDDMFDTPLDTAANIDILANDNGFVDPVTVTLPGAGASANGGTVVVNGSPGNQAAVDITYTPPMGFVGADTFDYTVADAANTSTATVTVDILSGANPDFAMTHLNTQINIKIGLNDIGFQSPVTVTVPPVGQPGSGPDMGGSVDAINGDTSGPGGNLTIDFTPAAAPGTATYTETFTYEITDGTDTGTAVVTVTVNNEIPVAVAAIASADAGGTAMTDVATLPGVDLGDAPSTISATDPSFGATSVSGTTITYTPDAGYTGADSYDYTITDADGETSTATVAVTVTESAMPVANPDAASVEQGDSVDIDVTFNDQPGVGPIEDHAVTITTPPSDGTATVGPGNIVTYTPNVDFFGNDAFQYTLRDVNGSTSTTTVSVRVEESILIVDLPSASGVGPWSLALLPLLPWLRNRRRRAKAH